MKEKQYYEVASVATGLPDENFIASEDKCVAVGEEYVLFVNGATHYLRRVTGILMSKEEVGKWEKLETLLMDYYNGIVGKVQFDVEAKQSLNQLNKESNESNEK